MAKDTFEGTMSHSSLNIFLIHGAFHPFVKKWIAKKTKIQQREIKGRGNFTVRQSNARLWITRRHSFVTWTLKIKITMYSCQNRTFAHQVWSTFFTKLIAQSYSKTLYPKDKRSHAFSCTMWQLGVFTSIPGVYICFSCTADTML